MNRKRPIRNAIILLVVVLLLLAAAFGYRQLTAVSFSAQLTDIRMINFEIWRPFSDTAYTPVALGAQAQQQIISLITAPTYYRDFMSSGYGGDTMFVIKLEGRNSNGTAVRYACRISNLGEIAIGNLDIGGEHAYLIDDHNPFVVSRMEPRALYEQIAKLAGMPE